MVIPLDKLVAPPNTRASRSEWQIAESAPARPFGYSFKPPVKRSKDLSRVLALPRRPLPDKDMSEALVIAMTEAFSRNNPSCSCESKGRKCITQLRRAQAWALYEMSKARGVLGSIGVGHGKTLLGLLAPFALGLQPGQIAVLLVPPSNVGEITDEYQLAGQHFRMPSITVHGTRFMVKQPGTPALHVMPYSRLSRPESTAWISHVNPAAIIADECDKLRNPQTATTSRVLRQFANQPNTIFCGWTGSLTDSSIEDYAHLAALALREKSPLPIDVQVVKDWARALDPSDYPAPGGALMDLCDEGEELRHGFQRRVRETLGIITTTEAAISAPLVITQKSAPEIPDVVQDALEDLRNTMCRPDGEEFVEALEVAKCARELACGFYYRWIFPRGEPVALIQRWFECRKAWAKELRTYLAARREGLDSPKLARDAAMRYWGDLDKDSGPVWGSEFWPAWRDVETLVKPDVEAVRLSPYLAEDAAEWGLSGTGIVWYGHKELGQWISEISGLPLHGGGPKARDRILAEKGDRSIVASIHSHGRGRNGLQFRFHRQLVASPPSSATAWEQLLGRLHRVGQEEGTIFAEYYAHTREFKQAIDEALRRAEYVNGTMGAEQKILGGLSDL